LISSFDFPKPENNQLSNLNGKTASGGDSKWDDQHLRQEMAFDKREWYQDNQRQNCTRNNLKIASLP